MIQFFSDMFAAPALWLLQLIEGTGMMGFFLAAFMTVMVCRILLAPVLGHAGSDTSKRSRSKEE